MMMVISYGEVDAADYARLATAAIAVRRALEAPSAPMADDAIAFFRG